MIPKEKTYPSGCPKIGEDCGPQGEQEMGLNKRERKHEGEGL